MLQLLTAKEMAKISERTNPMAEGYALEFLTMIQYIYATAYSGKKTIQWECDNLEMAEAFAHELRPLGYTVAVSGAVSTGHTLYIKW